MYLRAGLTLFACSLLGCAESTDTTADPGSGDDGGKADSAECSNGRKDAAQFPSIWSHYAIVEVANVVALEELGFLFDRDVLENLARARANRTFENLAAVGCIKKVGVAALEDLEDVSMGECGLGDSSKASASATPRMCFEWAMACGNDPFQAGSTQKACVSPTPRGTFTRDPADVRFAKLPVSVTFTGKRYTATYADGRKEEGRAQQSEKRQGDDGLFTYMSLRGDKVPFNDMGFYHMTLDGDSLVLDPLIGPIGRDEPSPVYTLAE